MKKTILLRGGLGCPIGIAIGYLISIITSLIWADGAYSPCAPDLTAAMGSEISAVIVQMLLCAVLGAGFSASSVVWDMEEWSIAKQTGIYFLINALVMLPTAWAAYWMEHSIAGFIGYFMIFVLIFLAMWIFMFLLAKRNVRIMNDGLRKAEHGK